MSTTVVVHVDGISCRPFNLSCQDDPVTSQYQRAHAAGLWNRLLSLAIQPMTVMSQSSASRRTLSYPGGPDGRGTLRFGLEKADRTLPGVVLVMKGRRVSRS